MFLWLYSRMRDLGEKDALIVKELDAGLKCSWSWAWLKLEFQVHHKGDMLKFHLTVVLKKKKKIKRAMQDASCVVKK